MKRTRYLLAGLGMVASVLVLTGVAALVFIPSDEELAKDAVLELEAALGVKVSMGSMRWRLFPSPAIEVENLATAQTPPVVIDKLTLYPSLTALWQRRLKINVAELEGAVVPQLSLRRLGIAGFDAAAQDASSNFMLAGKPLDRFVFRNVTWITRRGIPVMYDGEVDFDERWRPSTAQLRRPGHKPQTDASLTRVGQQDQWRVFIKLGGGTVNGELQLKAAPNGLMRLEGKLKPQGVEVANALAAFNRRPVLAGKATGDTALSASGVNFVELVQSLQTKTTFVMAPATLLRFDMGKAVRSAGNDHAGQTLLDSISGAMNTRNTPQGVVINFKDIKARSGALSAVGDATLANRNIEAELAVDLVDGIVGIPLKITGPTDKVVVRVPAGAVAGAVVGTAVLPGVGTAVGARVGAAIGKFFGTAPTPPANASRLVKP